MSGPDWRLETAYRPLWSADVPGLAWAYLCRNPLFLEDCARLELALQHGRLKVEDEDAFALRWGLRFRSGIAAVLCRIGLLDRPGVSQRRPSDDGAD